MKLESLAELIDHFDHPIDVKDIGTGKYILNNLAAACVSGLSKNERIGMDVHDIAAINKIDGGAVHKLVQSDQKVTSTSLPITLNHIFLNKSGTLLVDKVYKKTILGNAGKPIAILSYAYTVTQSIALIQLYTFYRMYYLKKQAVRRLLEHINLAKEFVILPTAQELTVLLAMQHHVCAPKYIGRLMRLSPRTIEAYKNRLRDKLKSMDFNQLLFILRSYGNYENAI